MGASMRQRSPSAQHQHQRSEEETDQYYYETGLKAKSLIESNPGPQHHSTVLKLHLPVLYSILPFFIQRIILNWSVLSSFFGLCPSWNERYLVLCGSFLYKFKGSSSSSIPKGTPFDTETISTYLCTCNGSSYTSINDGDRNNVYISALPMVPLRLPAGYEGVFVVSTLRKRHYYAVSNIEEAQVWIRCLNEAKQETITRNMGHATHVPYPPSHKYFDTLGKSLLKSKIRIRNRLEQAQMNRIGMEMEMTEFVGSTGYHS